jgi:hypothetical protein
VSGAADDPLTFDELINLLRVRLRIADAVNASAIHSFKELMSDQEVPDQWYWQALEELEAQGHLDPASHKVSGGDACGRLSAEGRWYLRSAEES